MVANIFLKAPTSYLTHQGPNPIKRPDTALDDTAARVHLLLCFALFQQLLLAAASAASATQHPQSLHALALIDKPSSTSLKVAHSTLDGVGQSTILA